MIMTGNYRQKSAFCGKLPIRNMQNSKFFFGVTLARDVSAVKQPCGDSIAPTRPNVGWKSEVKKMEGALADHH